MNSWDEIIFNNLNKCYGSYQLRKKYTKYLFFSLLISLALITIPICIVYIKYKAENVVDYFPYLVSMELDRPPDLEALSSPPPPPLIEPKQLQEVDVVPVVVDTLATQPEQIDKNKETKDDKNDSLKLDNNKSKDGNGFNVNGDSAIFFIYVDNLPEFPGGKIGLSKFIYQNTVYPDSAQRHHIEGRVLVQFVITKYGDVRDISILKGVNPLLDREALRVVSMFPKWKPGKRAGRPVNVRYQVPFSFKINYNSANSEGKS